MPPLIYIMDTHMATQWLIKAQNNIMQQKESKFCIIIFAQKNLLDFSNKKI